MTAGRQLGVLAAAFAAGTALGATLGAVNLGTALGVGQLCFAAALIYLLLLLPRKTSK